MARISGVLGLAALAYGIVALATGDRLTGIDALVIAALCLGVSAVTRRKRP